MPDSVFLMGDRRSVPSLVNVPMVIGVGESKSTPCAAGNHDAFWRRNAVNWGLKAPGAGGPVHDHSRGQHPSPQVSMLVTDRADSQIPLPTAAVTRARRVQR